MKPNELRIGNYVYGDDNVVMKIARIESEQYAEWNSGNDFCIISQDKLGENDYYEDRVNPIPLTEEWLIKAGFKSDDYKPGYIGIDVHNENGMSTDFVLSYPNRMGEWQKYFAWEFNNYMFNKIEYVHQLQNFYFAMTGYELVFSSTEL